MSITRVSEVFSATTTADTTFEGEAVALPALSVAGRYKWAMDLATNTLQVTVNGGAWTVIGLGACDTLDSAYDCGGAGAGRTVTADAGAVSIDASAGANACLLLTKASGGGAPAAFNPLDIVTDASQTGTAIRVTHDGGRGMDLIHSTATAFLGGITTTDSGTSVGAGGTFLDITCSNAGRTAGPFLRIQGAAASSATGTLIEASCGGAAGQQGLTVDDNGAGASTNAWILFAANNNLRTGPLLELSATGVANLTNYMRFGLCDTTVSTIAPLQKGQIALDAGDGLFKVSRNNNAYLPMIVGNPTLPYVPSNVVLTRSFDANSTSLNEIADVVGTLIIDLQNFGDTPLVG
jgi:hypothetical protein